MPRPFPLLRPTRLSLLAAVVPAMAACGHNRPSLASADASLRERDYGAAVGQYREISRIECGGGDAQQCCRALMGEGEGLLALGERHEALRALERSREQCPFDLTVRRKLYLAQHEADPEPSAANRTVGFTVDYTLAGLGTGARIVWAAVFLDGELVGRERSSVPPGAREVEAEVFLEGRSGPQKGKRLKLKAHKALTVPSRGASTELSGTVRLTLTEVPGSRPLEDGTRLEMDVGSLAIGAEAPAAELRPEERELAKLATQHAGIALREQGDPPRLPREIVRRGEGWTARVEICVAASGAVERIKFLEAAPVREPAVDAAILEAIRRWRYGRFNVDGTPRSFCHPHLVDLQRK